MKHKTIDLYFRNMKQIYKYNRFFTIAQNKYANVKSHLHFLIHDSNNVKNILLILNYTKFSFNF